VPELERLLAEQEARVTELERQKSELETQKAALSNDIILLRADIKKRKDQANRYKLALKQGDIKEPIEAEDSSKT
jgi:outer membrane murein-binding lipoprotein Lpp